MTALIGRFNYNTGGWGRGQAGSPLPTVSPVLNVTALSETKEAGRGNEGYNVEWIWSTWENWEGWDHP